MSGWGGAGLCSRTRETEANVDTWAGGETRQSGPNWTSWGHGQHPPSLNPRQVPRPHRSTETTAALPTVLGDQLGWGAAQGAWDNCAIS